MNTRTDSPANSLALALLGSAGAGVVTAGNLLLDAATKAGWHGLSGPVVAPRITMGH